MSTLLRRHHANQARLRPSPGSPQPSRARKAHRIYKYQARQHGLAHLYPRRHGLRRASQRHARELPREGSPPDRLPTARRQEDPGLPRCLPGGLGHAIPSAAPVEYPGTRPLRDGPRTLAPAGQAQVRLALPDLVSDPQRRASQSSERQAHDRGRLPRRRGRPARSPRQEGGAEARLRAHSLGRPPPARRTSGAALHGGRGA